MTLSEMAFGRGAWRRTVHALCDRPGRWDAVVFPVLAVFLFFFVVVGKLRTGQMFRGDIQALCFSISVI
jgi:hypothetical protein